MSLSLFGSNIDLLLVCPLSPVVRVSLCLSRGSRATFLSSVFTKIVAWSIGGPSAMMDT